MGKQSSSVVPSLESGDSTRNAILKLADILKRTDKIPDLPQSTIDKQTLPPKTASVPRVQKIPSLQEKLKENESTMAREPRVIPNKVKSWKRGEIPVSQNCCNLHSSSSDSYRFRAARQILAQHMFTNHIYNSGRKKETVGSRAIR